MPRARCVPLTAAIFDPADLPGILRSLELVTSRRGSVLPLPPVGSGEAPSRDIHRDICRAMRVGDPIPAGTLIACTSGSTGTPKGALLRAAALQAAGDATAAYLRGLTGAGPGAWLLALPPHHIAGIQVVLRSWRAGFPPVVAEHLVRGEGFTAQGFVEDVHRLRRGYPDPPLYTSLVPTQLQRLARHPLGVAALREFTAVLVGGAAVPEELLRDLRHQGVTALASYGSSETSGGVVYDGIPLAGVSVEIVDEDATGTGRIQLSGPMVASSYRNPVGCAVTAGAPSGSAGAPGAPGLGPAPQGAATSAGELPPTGQATPTGQASPAGEATSAPQLAPPGEPQPFPRPRTFTTSDLGRWIQRPGHPPRLEVLGRADGAFISGGLKVLPEVMEAAVVSVDGVEQACVVALPHGDFGQVGAAFVVLTDGRGNQQSWAHPGAGEPGRGAGGAATARAAQSAGGTAPGGNAQDVTAAIRERLEATLTPAHLRPARVWALPELPLTGPGKVDRRALRRLAETLASGS